MPQWTVEPGKRGYLILFEGCLVFSKSNGTNDLADPLTNQQRAERFIEDTIQPRHLQQPYSKGQDFASWLNPPARGLGGVLACP